MEFFDKLYANKIKNTEIKGFFKKVVKYIFLGIKS